MVSAPETEVVDQEVMRIIDRREDREDLNDEARMSNDEGMRKVQMTKSCLAKASVFGLRHSGLIRHSSSVIRHFLSILGSRCSIRTIQHPVI